MAKTTERVGKDRAQKSASILSLTADPPAGEETLDFDDDTSKGEDSCFSLTRSRCYTKKLFCVNLHS